MLRVLTFAFLLLGVFAFSAMGISFHFERNLRLKAGSTRAGRAAPRRGRNISRNFLYRMLGLAVIFCLGAGCGARVFAQEERPEIIPRRTRPLTNKVKRGNEPRAVGILQLNSNGKGSLIPVAILINGRFFDASAYKADPVPMALERGTVYEAEPDGDSQGLFTVNAALHNAGAGSAHPWLGTGSYLPNGAIAAKGTHKAENVPVGMDTTGDEGPPRLTKPRSEAPEGDAAKPDSGVNAGSGSAGQAPPAQPSQPPKVGTDSSATAPSSSAPPSAGPSSAGQASTEQASGNYYRPTLRRGKPTDAAADDRDDPTEKTVSASAAVSGTVTGAGATKTAEPIRLLAAISDAAGPEPESYKFFWKTGEEEERRNQMLALASAQVRAYAAALVKNHISATPASPKTASAKRKAESQAKPVFEDVQFHGFDLWLANQPVLVLTAKSRIPDASEAVAADQPYSVVLVARTDIYGNLTKLYAGVTDRFHLDVAPEMDLIDVVDADGDGLGELLFRKTSDAGSGYVIYRATADRLWKMFDSLNPE